MSKVYEELSLTLIGCGTWESRPSLWLTTELGRVGWESLLGSTVELALVVRVGNSWP